MSLIRGGESSITDYSRCGSARINSVIYQNASPSSQGGALPEGQVFIDHTYTHYHILLYFAIWTVTVIGPGVRLEEGGGGGIYSGH